MGVPGNSYVITDTTLVIETGFWPSKKRVVIPLANITSVERPALQRKLVVRTSDGKSHSIVGGDLDAAMLRLVAP